MRSATISPMSIIVACLGTRYASYGYRIFDDGETGSLIKLSGRASFDDIDYSRHLNEMQVSCEFSISCVQAA